MIKFSRNFFLIHVIFSRFKGTPRNARKHVLRSNVCNLFRQAKFGDEINIMKGGKRVGLKNVEDCTGANTDDLADDSDLDTSTCKYCSLF